MKQPANSLVNNSAKKILDKVYQIFKDELEDTDIKATLALLNYLNFAAEDTDIQESDALYGFLKSSIISLGELSVKHLDDPQIIASAFGKLDMHFRQVASAKKRHLPNDLKRNEVLRLYKDGLKSWKSMKDASRKIEPLLNAFCEAQKINKLSVQNCQRTIYEWIRQSKK